MKKKGLILITRPKKQAEILSKKLIAKGYKTVIEPLLKIKSNRNIDISEVDPKKILAVLITSNNAVFALSKFNLPEDILIIAVGKNTGDKIKKSGYKNVVCANNSASDLESLASQILMIKKGLVLYLSGNKVTLDLAESLNSKGFKAIRINVYETSEKSELSKNIIHKIRNNSINEILIYSLNTAEIFYNLILKHNLLEYCRDIKLSCLSKKISNYLVSKNFKNVGLTAII